MTGSTANGRSSGSCGATPNPTASPPGTHLASAAPDRSPADSLIPVLYGQLHHIATVLMGRAGGNHTLQPTALVHEAWLKIARGSQAPWDDQEHLLATAARAMRHALVDHARAKAAARRGGDRQRVEMPAVDDRCACQRVLELNDALQALAEVDPQLARLVELRAFGGLSIEEVARALAISPRSVKRGWAVAQSWLRCKLADDHGRAD